MNSREKNIFQVNLDSIENNSIDVSNIDLIYKDYLNVLKYHLSRDLTQLKILFKKISLKKLSSLHEKCFYYSSKLRYHILKGQIREKDLNQVLEWINLNGDDCHPVWVGELHFVLGLSFKRIKKIYKAEMLFKKSYLIFNKEKMHAKSILSLQLNLFEKFKQTKGKSKVAQLKFLYKKSERHNVSSVMISSLLDISKEYLLIQSHLVAYEYLKKVDQLASQISISSFQKDILNSLKFILFKGVGHETSSHYYYTKILNLDNKEIQEILSISSLWPQRQDNQKIIKSSRKVTKNERRLLCALKDKKLDIYELILEVYGDVENYKKAENKFKVMLSRLRRKYPNLIILTDGKYQIANTFLYDELLQKSA